MTMLRRVCRVFQGGEDTVYRSGQIVDASDWKNRVALESQLFIQPLDDGFVPIKTADGKMFDSMEAVQQNINRGGKGLADEQTLRPKAKAAEKKPTTTTTKKKATRRTR